MLDEKKKEEKENIKKTKWGMNSLCRLLFSCVLQAGFGRTAIFNTSQEAYPQPSIVPRHHRLASFAEAN